MRHTSSDLKIESPLMCSDTVCVIMLIVLDICSFPIPNDSGYMSLGDIETTLSNNQSREMY